MIVEQTAEIGQLIQKPQPQGKTDKIELSFPKIDFPVSFNMKHAVEPSAALLVLIGLLAASIFALSISIFAHAKAK